MYVRIVCMDEICMYIFKQYFLFLINWEIKISYVDQKPKTRDAHNQSSFMPALAFHSITLLRKAAESLYFNIAHVQRDHPGTILINIFKKGLPIICQMSRFVETTIQKINLGWSLG